MNEETGKRLPQVLVVDDELLQRRIVAGQLAEFGINAEAAASAGDALQILREREFDVVLLDVQMPGVSGVEALSAIRAVEDAPEVVMLTGDKSLETGIAAMRAGAYHYLTKPAAPAEMRVIIEKAVEKRRLVHQNQSLRELLHNRSADNEPELMPVDVSSIMRQIVAQAETVARLDSTVLITGESGTGKDVLARFIHERSQLARSPMIAVNCGALPESLFESEFFGHEKGAFTGASQTKRGLLEAADGSTLFLDEIGELPLTMQPKLLRFIESGTFRRVGATKDSRVETRIIAATNRDLRLAIKDNSFRADLFYRLNVINLHLPPLRERRADIPALVKYFLEVYRSRFRNPALVLTAEARRLLEGHDYPGNIRELKNTLERAAALTVGDEITAEQIVLDARADSRTVEDADIHITDVNTTFAPDKPILKLDELERQYILSALRHTADNRERAAALLGISERTLYRRLRDYNLI